MENEGLPEELFEVERLLRARPCPPAGSYLRRRVLGAVRAELRLGRAWAGWSLAAKAAAVVLAVNFITSAARTAGHRLGYGDGRPPVDAAAQEIRQVAPELSAEEAKALARSLRPAYDLMRRPYMPPPPILSAARSINSDNGLR